MSLDFERMGRTFVQEYYQRFDVKQMRESVICLYYPSALLTFEGDQFFGTDEIRKKLTEGFPMNNINRCVTKVDCQPTAEGYVIIFVIGQLQASDCEGDKPMGFSHMFMLKPCEGGSWFISNEIFRLTLHDFAAH